MQSRWFYNHGNTEKFFGAPATFFFVFFNAFFPLEIYSAYYLAYGVIYFFLFLYEIRFQCNVTFLGGQTSFLVFSLANYFSHIMSYTKRIAVTGGAGFIGSNLLLTLIPKFPHYLFVCIDKLNYASVDISDLEKFNNYKFVKADLIDQSSLFSILNANNITDIINLAAESCVDRSFESPVFFTTNNIIGTQNLLEFARCHPVRFIHISTDEVYGEQKQLARVNEADKLNPTNPYSATKASIDLIIGAYQYSYKLDVTIVRSNNVYGPNQYPEKIIPMTLHKLRNGEKITIHGDGHHRRSYLHISDFISAVELVWQNNLSGVFNVGSPYEISNLELVKKILMLAGVSDVDGSIEFTNDRMYNDSRYLIDYSKIQEQGWVPEISLDEGLADLVSSKNV